MHRPASMRPGQQSPRKHVEVAPGDLGARGASMRPGQQSPRKRPNRPAGAGGGRSGFNEAGATIAPETFHIQTEPPKLSSFNEAGATIAPETRTARGPTCPACRRFNEAGATIAPETAYPSRHGYESLCGLQ